MAYSVTDAWRAAVNGTVRRVYLLVEMLGIGRFFSNAPWGPGGPWTMGDGALMSTGLTMSTQHGAYETLISRLDDGGISSITESIDVESSAATIGQAGLKLSNTSLIHAGVALSGLENTAVRIRLLVGDGLGHDDALPLFYGFLDSWQATFASMELSIVAGAFRWHRNISETIGTFIPSAPDASRAASIPLLVGYNTEVEAIQISQAALGRLAFAVDNAQTFLILKETNAGFPRTGFLDFGSEASVPYTGREVTVINGQQYLLLTGLTRSAPVTHVANSGVLSVDFTYDFLIGYDIRRVDVVRENGDVITTGFTVALGEDIGAQRNVGLLRFDALPAGTITVDVEASNVNVVGQITNGGFESGTATGWTTSGGATTVTAGNTFEGAYKAELEGGDGSNATLSQTFDTRPGQVYILEFSWKDNTAQGSILTDGGFVNGLTSWVLEYLSPQATLTPSFGYNSGHLLRLETSQDVETISAIFYQDITVVNGTTYVIYVTGGFYAVSYRSITNSQPFGVNTIQFATIFYTLRGNGQSIVIEIMEAGVVKASITLPSATDPLTPESSFFYYTATSTSARFRVVMTASLIQDISPLAVLNIAGPTDKPFPLSIYPLRMEVVADEGKTLSSYVIGTTGDEDAYGGRTLPGRYIFWDTERIIFFSDEPSATLKLRSQHDNTTTPQATWFDGIRLLDQGRNAVDVIRYIIETFVSGLGIDDLSFDRAKILRINWTFNGDFRNPGNSRILLDSLAQQCACRRIETGEGVCKLQPIEYETGSPLYGFSRENILMNSVVIRPESIDAIFTEFHIYYGLRTGNVSGNPENYIATVFATPKSTSHPGLPLHILCQQALAIYGTAHRLDFFADAISEVTTALLLLEHLTRQHTSGRYRIRWNTVGLESSYLEIGDLVKINHPLLPVTPGIVEIIGKTIIFDRAMIIFDGRFARNAGVTEEWDFATVYELGFSVVEEWDATFTLETGEGVTEEWDT